MLAFGINDPEQVLSLGFQNILLGKCKSRVTRVAYSQESQNGIDLYRTMILLYVLNMIIDFFFSLLRIPHAPL